ncbi:Radical SAM family protein [Halomonas sp. A3H3]|uniref:cyclophane-forming radical SAM/SPASM peptide maturase YhhB n=1 Tax=Halomonas sp. A3H3 TaxID=1346287 RepID=UPI00038D418C|nr:cyclophane-forming radical SAM/SPASM peptide maturase YhhB [Halomonas sp. A3H3]CDG52305.1 Radical SAM family protein [Halomonas sp. A3H3]
MDVARFSSFLVKVASRCNLDCDYCYVYHHADQSWRSLPKLLSIKHLKFFAKRLEDYTKESNLKHCTVIFHGGEPLLAGAQKLADFSEILRSVCSIPVDISLQTNGLLLDEQALTILADANISISLSLDGPKTANDKHRLTRKGQSSFDKTEKALKLLQNHPEAFTGVIAVIDASTSPDELFEYFDRFQIPRLDFLLPDANWFRQPPGRNQDPGLYEQWLVKAFDVWLDRYAHIPLRTFEALLDVCAGLPSSTDAFGFGDVSLLSIETDGSYHDLDVLKITQEGATRLFGNVLDTPIADVACSAPIQKHREYLSKDGLSVTCQSCEIVEICGGGSLPHRFGENGFVNPTVYCNEMKRLIGHISDRLQEHLDDISDESDVEPLPEEFDLACYERAEMSAASMTWLANSAEIDAITHLRSALSLLPGNEQALRLGSLPEALFSWIALHPGTIAWSSALIAQQCGQTLSAVDGSAIDVNPAYLHLLVELADSFDDGQSFDVGRDDQWLRAPFGGAIFFEGAELTFEGRALVNSAMAIVRDWRPALAAEMMDVCRAVQFVRDPAADPSKIVSFSDNSVPGALYVSISQGDYLIDPYDLADSLIHEHRHQKLYLLERHAPTIERTAAQVVSPWREDLRPPSGLLHAVFVFVELRRFWMHVRDRGPANMKSRAVNQIADTDSNLKKAFATLRGCPLTDVGQTLVMLLRRAAVEGKKSDEHVTHFAPNLPVIY